ncbi:MAG: hypothetical protein ACE5HI_14870 [bacterium]
MQVALTTAPIGERLFFPIKTKNHAMLLVFEKTENGVIPTFVNTGVMNGGKKHSTKFVYSEMPILTAINSKVLSEFQEWAKYTQGTGDEIPEKLKQIWGKITKKKTICPSIRDPVLGNVFYKEFCPIAQCAGQQNTLSLNFC